MAEGAKFFLISPDFELKRLAEFSPDRQDKVERLKCCSPGKIINFLFQIFSFSFYSLLDSSSKKYKDLARRLNLCYFRKQKKNTHITVYRYKTGVVFTKPLIDFFSHLMTFETYYFKLSGLGKCPQ